MYLNKTNLGDKGLTILVESLKVVSNLKLVDNDIHTSGVSCLADAVCSGKFKMDRLDLSDNPLGLEGTVAVGRMLGSCHCKLLNITLCMCDLTSAGFVGLQNTGRLNLGTSTMSSVAVGQQLCQMPQSSAIAFLRLDGNSFTGEGIHILAGIMHLCPCLWTLKTGDCGIMSDDLIRLLDELTQFNPSSPSICSKLEDWYLNNNQINDRGVSVLMDHLPSLFPRLGCGTLNNIYLSNNLVSAGMKKKLKEELIGRKEVSYSVPYLL